MLKFIEVPIVCNNPELAHLKELNIPFNESQYDIRVGKINVALINGYYPDNTGQETIVDISGSSFSVAMCYSQFDAIVCK